MKISSVRSVFLLILSIVFALNALLLIFPTTRTSAANGFIDPNADGSIGSWNSTGANRYTEIDEGTRQPTTPTLTDNISGVANGAGSYFARMSTISGVTTVSDVTVWIHHNDGSNGQINVQLYDDNETTTRSTETALTQSTTNAWHSVTFSSLTLTQAQLDSLSIRLRATRNGGGQAATITIHAVYADVTYSTTPTTFEQSGYRLFAAQNSTNVGTPLAGQNAGAVLLTAGTNFRLRLLMHVGGNNVSLNSETFKLQYVDPGSGSCTSPSGGTPATYTDITTTTLIAYRNTPSVGDGDTLTTNANDPTHSSDSVIAQTYEEANNFSNSVAAINAGQDGMWDFSLTDNGAAASTTYCIRAVKSSGTALDTYTHYAQVTTSGGILGVDIVDAGNVPVASPAVSMSAIGYTFDCISSTGTLGSASQKVQISNYTANPAWNVSIAATSGATSSWSSGGSTYDFNDISGTPNGCADGGDADSLAGRLQINPSIGTITPQGSCTTTGVTLGSSASFNQGVVDAVSLISGSTSASSGCTWDVTGMGIDQTIPAQQASGTYSINLTITITAQ